MSIAAILLAAGESMRMGQPKPLLPWDGTTLVDWQASQLRDAGADDVIVVLGHRAGEVRAAVPAFARIVNNEEYTLGRASSLRAGAAAVADNAEAVLVLGVDQPRPARVTSRLIEEWMETRAAVIVPAFEGHRGHPVLVDGSLLGELRAASEEDMGLRGVLQRHASETRVVEIGSPVVNLDINTPEDYETALRAFRDGLWRER